MDDFIRFIIRAFVIIIGWYVLKKWKEDWDEEMPTYTSTGGKIFGNIVKYVQLVLGVGVVYIICSK